jgi:hypothetical protein
MVAHTAAQPRGPGDWWTRSDNGAVARKRSSIWAEVAIKRDDGYREVDEETQTSIAVDNANKSRAWMLWSRRFSTSTLSTAYATWTSRA